MAMKPKSDYSIQTVSNALRMLESFYKSDELGVSELSRRLRLHKNNVFRLLATLEEHGYIEQSLETERYRLGTRCLELSQSFARGNALLQRAHPILNELAPEHPNGISCYEDLITFVTDRPGHDRRYAIDSTKLKETLDWFPRVDFESGLRETAAWYLNNKKWWQHPQRWIPESACCGMGDRRKSM